MRRHGIDIVVLAQSLIGASIDCLDLHEELSQTQTSHLIEQGVAEVHLGDVGSFLRRLLVLLFLILTRILLLPLLVLLNPS